MGRKYSMHVQDENSVHFISKVRRKRNTAKTLAWIGGQY